MDQFAILTAILGKRHMERTHLQPHIMSVKFGLGKAACRANRHSRELAYGKDTYSIMCLFAHFLPISGTGTRSPIEVISFIKVHLI
jgi:hypothetical protein